MTSNTSQSTLLSGPAGAVRPRRNHGRNIEARLRGNSVETRAEPRDSRSRPLPANLAVDHAAPEGDAVSDPRSEIAAGLAGEEVEQVVPHLAEKLMPGLLFVLFAGALVSAILSTVDSVLLASAAQVSHNIVMRLRPEASERVKLLSARLTVVAMAAVACVLALTARSIRDLVEVASAAGSPGLIVCLLFGLCSQFGGPLPRPRRSWRARRCGSPAMPPVSPKRRI